MEDTKKEIPTSTKWLMRGVAVFFDLLSLVILVPVIGWILGWIVWFFAGATFWTWFMMYGVNIYGFKNPKKLFGSLLASFTEVLPEIGAIPAWTLLIIYLTGVEKVVSKVVDKVPGGSNVVKFVPRSKSFSNNKQTVDDTDLEEAA